jgi:hypothetical protein
MRPQVTLLIISFAFFMAGCSTDDQPIPTGPEGCYVEVPCVDPNGLISVEEADILEEEYKSKFYGMLNDITSNNYPGYEGAGRYVWFDLEEIKKYIVYIEKNAEANGYAGKLGLRVYMGAKYQNNAETGNPEPRQTVFFVPTVNPTGGSDFEDNINITSMKRLNLGGAGIPDDMDQEIGN